MGFVDLFALVLRWLGGKKAAAVEFDVPGLEWTLAENRCHYVMPLSLSHSTLLENRCHYGIPEDD